MKDIISGKYILDTDYKISMKLFNANYGKLADDTILDQHLIRDLRITHAQGLIFTGSKCCVLLLDITQVRFIYIISALGFYFFKFLSCALDQKICYKLDCFHLKEKNSIQQFISSCTLEIWIWVLRKAQYRQSVLLWDFPKFPDLPHSAEKKIQISWE